MHSRIRAWAQLVRIPNTLTACADVLAGFSIAVGSWFRIDGIDGIAASLLLMCSASVCFYWAGMVLNDVHDIEADRIQGRKGPLVDGRIPIRTAAIAGWTLLFTGICLAAIASYVLPSPSQTSSLNQSKWLVVGVGVLLASVIAAYDSRLKATVLGPLLMGLCRGLNLLLGLSLGWNLVWPSDSDWIVIAVAVLGHVGFVMGITLAARREGLMHQSTSRLAIAWGVSFLGIVAIALCPLWASDRPLSLDPWSLYPILIGLLMAPWLRRAVLSVRDPGVGTLVPAIKQAILSIIFLDAAIALQFAGSTAGMIVCSLAIPTLALARFFRMT